MFSIQVQKTLSHFTVDVAFQIDNEIAVLFGPSGSGKTTVLNMIAGLVHPDSGSILLKDAVFFRHNQRPLSPRSRGIGYLFQDYALFPHMTVAKNIQYGIKKTKGAVRLSPLLEQVLDVLSIRHLLDKYPQQISGGEKQRVALARALAAEPAMLLLDEPMSALDTETRLQCQEELLRLHNLWRIPFIIVTHDRSEAQKLGDVIFFLEKGKIVERVVC